MLYTVILYTVLYTVILCYIYIGAEGMTRVTATKAARALPKPKLTNATWGAGLSFAKCHAERKVPYGMCICVYVYMCIKIFYEV